MKKMTAALITLFAMVTLYAQQAPGKITGKILGEGNQPIVSASVSVYRQTDSSLVKGTMTDIEGNFSFTSPEQGNYYIIVSAIGYEKARKVGIAVSQDRLGISLGNIVLQKTSRQLQEVIVASVQRPLIEHQVDKALLNVENSILAAGNTALELLQQAPYVTVDNDGNITLRGKESVTVMIDGRPTYLSADDLANLLRNTSSDQVSRIEVITNPSSKYEASGTGGIINIKMKRNKRYGLNGSFTSSIQQGRMPRLMEGVNLNYRKGSLNVFGGLTYSKNERWNEESTITEFYNPDKSLQTSYNIFEKAFYYSHSVNLRTGIDYTLSPKTTMGVLFNGSTGTEDERSDNTNHIRFYTTPGDSVLLTAHTGVNDWKRYSFNINLKHDFDSTGRSLTIDADAASFTDKSLPFYQTVFYNNVKQKTGQTILDGNMRTGITMYSAKADYEQPLGKTIRFSAGVKWSRVQTDNQLKYLQNGILDEGRTNDFIYTETIHAAYSDMAGTFKKLSVKLGLRLEQTIAKGLQKTIDSSFNRNYAQLFPNIYFRYQWNENHSSGLSINKRISRPDYESLNPFVYFSDPFTSWSGNPYLKPGLSQSFDISHNYKNKLTLFAGYSRSKDMITSIQRVNSNQPGYTSSKENIGHSEQVSFGISNFGKLTKWWRANTNVFLFHTVTYGGAGIQQSKQMVTSFRVFSSQQFTLSKKYNAEMNFWYRPASLWGVLKTGPVGSFSIGVQRKVMKDNGTLKLTMNDLFGMQKMRLSGSYDQLHTSSFAVSENRCVRLALTINFGNKNIKAERDRNSGIDEEKDRVRGRD